MIAAVMDTTIIASSRTYQPASERGAGFDAVTGVTTDLFSGWVLTFIANGQLRRFQCRRPERDPDAISRPPMVFRFFSKEQELPTGAARELQELVRAIGVIAQNQGVGREFRVDSGQ